MVRTVDLENKEYEENVKYISEHAYNYLSKTKIYGGEIIINKIGCPGKTYLMPKLNKKVSLGMNLFLLRLKENSKINEKLLWIFFNTEIGKKIINRKVNGTVPLTIDKDAIKSLYIPYFSESFQNKIEKITTEILDLETKEKSLYKDLEKEIENIFDLNLFDEYSKLNINIKNLSESFNKSNRLDSEYYQKKYDYLLTKLEKIEYQFLGGEEGIVNIKKSIEPGSEEYQNEGIPFIRISNFNKFGINTPDIFLDPLKFTKEDLFLKKDNILLSKDGSIGIAYKIEEDLEMITSSGIIHLTIKDKSKILPNYLTLLLNSKLVKYQAERDLGGTIIPHWKISEIEKLKIPILDIKTQERLSNQVDEVFNLKRKAKRLFDKAIQAFEIAILSNEQSAMKYLEKD